MSQQEPEKKGKDLLARLGQTIRYGAETIVQETKELTRIGKLKVELISLENERGRKFQEIGRLAHTLYKGGKAFPDELTELFSEIDEIEKRINQKNWEIDRIRQEGGQENMMPGTPGQTESAAEAPTSEQKLYCPKCGARLDEGDVFCSRCGTKVN